MMKSYLENMEYDYIFKLIIIGDTNVGKSSIMKRYINNVYEDNQYSTIGVDFGVKNVLFNNKKVKLQLWDTAGQERFRAITTKYYKGVNAIIIMYDVSDRSTFDNVGYWLDEVYRRSDDRVPIMLIGSKCDVSDIERKILMSEGLKYADDNGLMFMEVSSKSNINVEKVFKVLLNKLMGNIRRMVFNVGSDQIQNVNEELNNINRNNVINNGREVDMMRSIRVNGGYINYDNIVNDIKMASNGLYNYC